MKNKILFLILFSFLFASEALPQQTDQSIGFISGISLNTNSIDIDYNNNFLDTSYSNSLKTTFIIGLFYQYDFVQSFGIKLQGQYINKGGISKNQVNYSSSTTPISRNYRNTENYLQFSLLPQLNLLFDKNNPKSKAYFGAGGYLSALLSASENLTFSTNLQSIEYDKDITNNLTGTDLGLVFAAGIIYEGFLFDLRYDLGLTNIVDIPDIQDVLNIKNNSINITVGWTGGL